MKTGTHSLGKNRSGNSVFAKALSNGDVQIIGIGSNTRAEINLSAEQAELLKDVLA